MAYKAPLLNSLQRRLSLIREKSRGSRRRLAPASFTEKHRADPALGAKSPSVSFTRHSSGRLVIGMACSSWGVSDSLIQHLRKLMQCTTPARLGIRLVPTSNALRCQSLRSNEVQMAPQSSKIAARNCSICLRKCLIRCPAHANDAGAWHVLVFLSGVIANERCET